MASPNPICILKDACETNKFVEEVQKFADRNTATLGFTPKLAYVHAAARGRLWVAIDDQGGYCGHLYFGGKHPNLRIWQLFVPTAHRNQGIGRELVNALVRYGEERHYDVIIARVAADLKANQAWGKFGFSILRQVPGGRSTNRNINVRIRELSTPSLFGYATETVVSSESDERLIFANNPISGSPNYVLDVNVLLDIVKGRADANLARTIISIGLSGTSKILVSEEFVEELERNTENFPSDPVLELAKALPQFPQAPDRLSDAIKGELSALVFPGRAHLDELSQNQRADIEHLASSIHHGMTGFITSDVALLRAGECILEAYEMDVLSPGEFCNRFSPIGSRKPDMLVSTPSRNIISIRNFDESNRSEIEEFLASIGIHKELISDTMSPGTQYNERVRLIVTENDKQIGVATWTRQTDASSVTRVYLFIDESSASATRAIDHILESIHRDCPVHKMVCMELIYNPDQDVVHQTARERGYRSIVRSVSGTTVGVRKVVYRGMLSESDWPVFRRSFGKITGVTLSPSLPTFPEAEHTGLLLTEKHSKKRVRISLFDFETLVSPVLTLCKGRNGIIVPIQKYFADDLLSSYAAQMSILPDLEASLYVEKAYFRSSNRASMFKAGMPVFFYVSGHGGGAQEVVGHGRVTFSGILTIEEAHTRLSRQGVLPKELLRTIAKNGKLHAFTFDNFNLFLRPVTYIALRHEGIIKSSLQTAERILWRKMKRLCELGYSSSL